MIKGIIFDMDGVLFDTERLALECWHTAGDEMGLGDVEEGILGCIGLNHEDTRTLMLGLYGEDFPFEEYIERTRELMRQKMDTEGVPMKEGVLELLNFLQERKLSIGLASSSTMPSILQNLEGAGIKDFFQQIISGDMVKHSKPQPDIYRIACSMLSLSPEEALTIEDSPNGIKSSFAAGIKTIMVPDLIPPTPELMQMVYQKFDSLLEVMDFLGKGLLAGTEE